MDPKHGEKFECNMLPCLDTWIFLPQSQPHHKPWLPPWTRGPSTASRCALPPSCWPFTRTQDSSPPAGDGSTDPTCASPRTAPARRPVQHHRTDCTTGSRLLAAGLERRADCDWQRREIFSYTHIYWPGNYPEVTKNWCAKMDLIAIQKSINYWWYQRW